MMNEERKPRKYDLVLGGDNPPPTDGLVLGGIEGVKNRLTSDNIQYQIKALSEALNYGDAGLDLVIDALSNYKREVRQNAYHLLQQREEKKAEQAVSNYKFWYLDKCSVAIGNEYTEKILTKKEINNFNLKDIINNPEEIAYRIRDYEYKKPYSPGSLEYLGDIKNIFNTLIAKPQAKNIKELIFGCFYSSNIIQIIVDAKKQLPNLTSLFLGDAPTTHISRIEQGNISPILVAYPNLERLQLRGGKGLRLNSKDIQQHDNLKMLRIESGGLPREAINDLCKSKLPALEYLELWIGTPEYGGDSTIQDLIPILQGNLFPKLKYLGLRNAEYTDDIAIAIAKSTIIKQLIELDLSLGTLCKKGAQALINCPHINELDTLDISYNYLEASLYPDEFEQILYLNCDVIAESQNYWDVNWEHDINIPIDRYCQVRE